MKDNQQNSLELLLDTITNTFGGIVFLAMLVVVLLQLTSNTQDPDLPDPETESRLHELQGELIAAKKKRNSLRQATDVQAQMTEELGTENNWENLAALKSARREKQRLDSQRIELAQTLVSKQVEINNTARAIKNTKNRLEVTRNDLEEAKRDLTEEIESRTTTAKLPRMHETTKAEIAIVLRYDRIYFPHKYDASLGYRRVNADEMVILESTTDELVITPKPYAGIAISESGSMRDAMRTKLQRFPKGTVYLAIGVWDDSFDPFIELKNVLVELGYEYRVMPVKVGQAISERSGISPRVQ